MLKHICFDTANYKGVKLKEFSVAINLFYGF